MSVRVRVLGCVAVAALMALVVGASTVSPAGAAGASSRGALLNRCLSVVLFGSARAHAVSAPGSGAAIAARYAVFRRPRTAADTLPAGIHLGAALGFAHATTFDRSALVRLRRVGSGAVYAVPASIAPVPLPAGCAGLPQLRGIDAYSTARNDELGTGPGACLLVTRRVPTASPGPYLPGAKRPAAREKVQLGGAVCYGGAALTGYVGTLGGFFAQRFILLGDGVTTITYALASGAQFTVPVSGNLAQTPTTLTIPPSRRTPTAATLTSELTAHLPTTVTETGPSGQLVATLTRPDTIIPDVVAEFTFLKRLVTSAQTSGSSSSSSTSIGGGASCVARTHRCVAVTVTTSCNTHHRCRTTRSIHRYRYVGTRPPRGTTGPDTQPTAPIVGRGDRLVRHPGKLSLVLDGTPQRHAVVIVAVTCFSRNGEGEAGGPALSHVVPSRIRISLPGRPRSYRACDVSVLVTSTQRGPVRVRVVRG